MFDEKKQNRKDEHIWAYKYKPKTVDDIILIDRIHNQFKQIVDSGNLSDILLYGPPGTGKTTFASLLASLLDLDMLKINGSIDTSIDVIRGDVRNFTKRYSDRQKVVFIDESDRLSPTALDGLKAEIEECQKSYFIFTSNHIEKIIPPIISRCGGGISFYFNGEEKQELLKKYYKRAIEILTLEKVEHDQKAVAKVIMNHFPDFRNTIHTLQRCFTQFGCIDMKSVDAISGVNLDTFFQLIKSKNLDKIRQFIYNMNSDTTSIYSSIVSKLEDYVEINAIGSVIDMCYEHMINASKSADPNLVLIHFCYQMMRINLK